MSREVVGTIGSAWQLIHSVTGDKAAQLRRLGCDPTLGVALNLAYSATAVVVLIYAWRAHARDRDPASAATRGR